MPLSADPDSRHRRRLLDAMAEAVARKGFASTTIADLAAGAQVSRRTFYEYFATKEACLVALYEAASRQALGVLSDAIDPAHDPLTQAEQALQAYLATLASNPALLKTLFIAILGLGPAGLQARRRVNIELADLILEVVNRPHDGPQHPPLTPPLALAIVGGVNELVLQRIEQDRVAQLPELSATTAQFVRAVVNGPR